MSCGVSSGVLDERSQGVWPRAPQVGLFPNQKTESQACLRWIQAPTGIAFWPEEKKAEVPGNPCSLWGSSVEQLGWGGLKPCQYSTFMRPDDLGAGQERLMSIRKMDPESKDSLKGKKISAHFRFKPKVSVFFLWPMLW